MLFCLRFCIQALRLFIGSIVEIYFYTNNCCVSYYNQLYCCFFTNLSVALSFATDVNSQIGNSSKRKVRNLPHVVVYQRQHISDNVKQIYKHGFYPLQLLWLSLLLEIFFTFFLPILTHGVSNLLVFHYKQHNNLERILVNNEKRFFYPPKFEL
jgi:hypothetical protein